MEPRHITVEASSGTLKFAVSEDPVSEELLKKIRDAVAAVGGHALGGDSGEHILKFACMDTRRAIRGFSTIARDDAKGGRILARKTADLRDLIHMTHDGMPVDTIGHVAASLYCAGIPDASCILAFPPEPFPADILWALGVRHAVELKVCDGKGLGKSTPRFSETKFDKIVPDAPKNVRRETKKRPAKTQSPPPAPVKIRRRSCYDILVTRVATSKALTPADRERALKFLGAFDDNADDHFDGIFGPLCDMGHDVSAIAISHAPFMLAAVRELPPEETLIIDALTDYIATRVSCGE